MITQVTTNIKSPTGKTQTRQIGKRTLLEGPNESGKSTIGEAIQLAVGGSVYGILFRDKLIKGGNHLASLGTFDNGTPLFAEVTFEDGSSARWEMEEGKRPAHTGSDSVTLPVAELHSVLSGSAQSARKFFFQRLIAEVSGEDLETFLKENSVHNLIPALEQAMPDYGPASCNPMTVVAAIGLAGTQKRKEQARVTALTSHLADSTVEDIEPSDLTDAWDRLRKALCLEWARKHVQLQNLEKRTAHYMVTCLASTKELRALPGSAQVVDEIELLLERKMTAASARRVHKNRGETLKKAECFKELEEKLDLFLFQSLKEPLKKYAKKVNTYLPRADKFQITHTASSFSVGLERNGVLHKVLSGSTEARVLAAMSAGLMDMMGKTGMIIVDDRMWDTKTLSKTMAILEKCDHQVILMSTIRPKGRKRGEWTYVAVEAEEEKSADDTIVEASEEAAQEEPEQAQEDSDEEDILDALFE